MVIIGIFRIVSTYSVFWETKDEAFHVATGMEWLSKGQYTIEQFHPPLARVMCALGPYVAGIRGTNKTMTTQEADKEGYVILNTGGKYERNLSLSRMGILPFFIIASLVVAYWTKEIAGPVAALLATLLFTTLPPILAHAGLATQDMACTALVAAALYAFVAWLKNPTFSRSIVLGLTAGLSILVKFSAIGFIAAAVMLIIPVIFCFYKSTFMKNCALVRTRDWVNQLFVIVTVCVLTIWAGYRFSFGFVISAAHGPYNEIDRIIGNGGIFHDCMYKMLENTPVIAPEFIKGLAHFFLRNTFGHLAYMFGNIQSNGRWYYFPLTLLVKTPIPFILFAVVGFAHILKNINRKEIEISPMLGPAIAVFAVLLIGMLGNVNNGLRQILCIYPMLSIIAGCGAFLLCSNSKFRAVGVVIVPSLILWQLVSSYNTHPDYLTYFNVIARNRPYEFGVDSDLDWGQDFKRLATKLNKDGIKELNMNANDAEQLKVSKADLPAIHELVPNKKVTGWVAISIRSLFLGTDKAPYDQFSWLRKFEPVEKVGQSLLLYFIPK